MKRCTKCKIEKQEFEFHTDASKSDGLYPQCADCVNKHHRKRKYNLQRDHGLSLRDYEVMVRSQDNRCGICKQKKKLAVDHDHKTGKIRELLCNNCNAMIGMADDNSETLKAAIKYLEKHK